MSETKWRDSRPTSPPAEPSRNWDGDAVAAEIPTLPKRPANLSRRKKAPLSFAWLVVPAIAFAGILAIVLIVRESARELTPAEKQAREAAAAQADLDREVRELQAEYRYRQKLKEQSDERAIEEAQAVLARAILDAAAQAERSP